MVLAAIALAFFVLLRTFHQPEHHTDIKSLPTPGPVQMRAKPKPEDANAKPAPAPAAPSPTVTRLRPSYKSVRPQGEQVALSDPQSRPLREQLAYQFPYDREAKFPAYIWQTWKTTPASGDFDEALRQPEASWTELHPTFVHEVITDSVALAVVRHLYGSVPAVVDAYKALPLPVLKADFLRYLILLARGGIYSDIDTLALQPATEWVPAEVPRSSYGLVVGIEADPDRPDWHDWYSRRVQLCQWTIQAKPGHPVLIDIVSRITEETLARKKEGRLSVGAIGKGIVEFTGPAIWTDVIFKYFNDPTYFDMSTSKGNITWEHFTGIKAAKMVGDVVILPITSFSPGVNQMGAGEDDDPMAFVKHLFIGM